MKKSLLAFAILGAFAGVASAQSSVTLFGVVDLSANVVKNGSARVTTLSSDQLNTSRIGFRGVEDLGGGLGASFWLEGALQPDAGTTGGANGLGTTAFFNRRATASLTSKVAGEFRLGRDYVPSYWNFINFDVNGANGLGQGYNLFSALNSGALTGLRDNNVASYFLPGDLGGVYGQLTAAAGEGVPGQKYAGGRLGYATGPFNAAVAYGQTKTANTSTDFKVANVGASYDFSVVKLFGLWDQNKFGSIKQNLWEISAAAPVGAGEFRASYARSKITGGAVGTAFNNGKANLYSLEYIYNLSKRTAVYGTAGRVSNSNFANFTVGAALNTNSALNTTSTGYNFGVRHSF